MNKQKTVKASRAATCDATTPPDSNCQPHRYLLYHTCQPRRHLPCRRLPCRHLPRAEEPNVGRNQRFLSFPLFCTLVFLSSVISLGNKVLYRTGLGGGQRGRLQRAATMWRADRKQTVNNLVMITIGHTRAMNTQKNSCRLPHRCPLYSLTATCHLGMHHIFLGQAWAEGTRELATSRHCADCGREKRAKCMPP